jgi:hypothetical protein
VNRYSSGVRSSGSRQSVDDLLPSSELEFVWQVPSGIKRQSVGSRVDDKVTSSISSGEGAKSQRQNQFLRSDVADAVKTLVGNEGLDWARGGASVVAGEVEKPNVVAGDSAGVCDCDLLVMT